jgi:1-acyl-sn-glycerol-3-phosphate acyltransferase
MAEGKDSSASAKEDAPEPDDSAPKTDGWDPVWVGRIMPLLRTISKLYFRSEVTGMEKVPDGGVLLVSNHSGGAMAYDVPLLAVAFSEEFGEDRPLCTLAHDLVFIGQGDAIFRKFGFLPAHPRNAVAALQDGIATLVFPGGDWDAMRPTSDGAKIDFNGNKGYVRTAIKAGVPIVPIVTIGGQETQLFLNDGAGLAKFLRLDKLIRAQRAPLVLGFPFGLGLGMTPNVPLPSKMVTRVLDPIDITSEFGDDPDVDTVDELVRSRMQAALDELADERRFPIIG